ncbi:MAG: hypothetical protein R2776_03495 [Flavobacteriaceae bacterium]|nr:hypothetical protein [Flavobacteriaceae bacterium]
MNSIQIKAIGNFLQYYETDLNYIREFQNFKKGTIELSLYKDKVPNGFYKFLIEFRIIRNIPSGTSKELLIETQNWVKNNNADNVDLFVEKLLGNDISRKKRLVSLASKVLFLNNPWKIIPMDVQTRKSLDLTENNYTEYQKRIKKFKEDHSNQIKECLKFVEKATQSVHSNFVDIPNIDVICENRMIDKILWVKGVKMF